MKKQLKWLTLLLCLMFLMTGCDVEGNLGITSESCQTTVQSSPSDISVSSDEKNIQLDSIPEYSGKPYVVINDNQPFFTDADLTEEPFENYSDLDELGRCGVAYANICIDLMPTEERGSISQVKPTGWHSVRYDNVDGKSLYNRCHLIGWQLAGENANEKNLITGTRYMNLDGMLPFENMIADYVKETDHHVLYRVTPIFEGDNLVASGVEMEAMSVEDNGDDILFNVYCYNVQPDITIDYATGDSYLSTDSTSNNTSASNETTYILNENTMKFHTQDCPSVKQMNPENRKKYTGNRQDLLDQGYEACQKCHP